MTILYFCLSNLELTFAIVSTPHLIIIVKLSNQSFLKQINPECSLEGLMLKLKLQYFGSWLKKTTHWKRPWCWGRLRAGGEGGGKDETVGWHHQLYGPEFEQSSGRQWRTGKPGVMQALGSQRARHDWVTEQQPPFILSGRRKKKKKNTSYMHQVHTPFKPHSITREKVPALSEITGSLPWKRPVMLEWERRMDFSSLQHLSLGGQELDMVHGPGCLCD